VPFKYAQDKLPTKAKYNSFSRLQNLSKTWDTQKIKDIFRCPFLFRRMDLIFYIITISRVRRHKEITNKYSSKYVLGETRLFGVQILAGG
jgi:hypothetical protein